MLRLPHLRRYEQLSVDRGQIKKQFYESSPNNETASLIGVTYKSMDERFPMVNYVTEEKSFAATAFVNNPYTNPLGEMGQGDVGL